MGVTQQGTDLLPGPSDGEHKNVPLGTSPPAFLSTSWPASPGLWRHVRSEWMLQAPWGKDPKGRSRRQSHPSSHQDHLQPAPKLSPDQLPEDVCPAHACRMVDRGAAVVPAAVGVSPGFQEDLGTLEVSIDHGYVEGGLPLHVHQVDLGSFLEEKVHAGAVAGGGGDAQRRAGQPATAPHRLLVDPAGIGREKQWVREALLSPCTTPPPPAPKGRESPNCSLEVFPPQFWHFLATLKSSCQQLDYALHVGSQRPQHVLE